jgi:hypothetical protein
MELSSQTAELPDSLIGGLYDLIDRGYDGPLLDVTLPIKYIIKLIVKPEFINLSDIGDMSDNDLLHIFYEDITIYTKNKKIAEDNNIKFNLLNFCISIFNSSFVRINGHTIDITNDLKNILIIPHIDKQVFTQIIDFTKYIDKLKEDGRIPLNSKIYI